MFYRIKNNELLDYADYKYAEDCLSTNICSMEDLNNNKDYFIIVNNQLEHIPNLEEILKEKKRSQFEKEFFNTSLGWIRRNVNMKDGSKKDFLSDLLPAIKAGIELGQNVQIITYKTPDFDLELTVDYMESLQERKNATLNFIQECLLQTVNDFGL